jgi:Zn-dependent protease with chaperone function
MGDPQVRPLQVVLTGARLVPCSDEELLARLQTRLKLAPPQAAAMLRSGCIVKRGITAPVAEKIVAVLAELGVEAVIEETPSPPVPAKPASKAASPPVQKVASPAAHKAPSRPDPDPNPLEALRALAGQRLPKPRASLRYLLGLLAVTLLCLALPALYFGLTCGIAFGWLWYLTHIHKHLPHSAHLIALIYGVPGLMGAMLLLFLVRPLFVTSTRRRETLPLDADREAGFVAGVHALCRAIGVSPPVEIRLSWDANASVHFHGRWLGLFTGRKVLTLGLSLVGGLSARQFVGVLAHEFGHFAQRFGMICTFTVNSVNAWLEHCAYGEDSWTRKLREWSETAMEQEHWFSWIVHVSVGVSWLAIGLTRHLMAGLFHISLSLSRYMSRQMEFDADRYEALLAGSGEFRITARSLRALEQAFEEVNQANIGAWKEHRLLADLPQAVAAHARDFDAKRLARVEEQMREHTTTRYWDSHPPDVERIDNAEKRHCPGIYLEEAPAERLFKDFGAWSRRATRLFYSEQGVPFKEEQLRPREEILGHVRNRNQQREQLNRFFNGQFQDWPLLRLPPWGAPVVDALGWQECIDRIRGRSPEIARYWLQAFQAHQRRPILRTAVKLNVSSRELGMAGPERSPEELEAELDKIVGGGLPYTQALEETSALYAQRIDHAIDSMPEPERRQAIGLRKTLVALGELEPAAAMLVEHAGVMSAFISLAQASGDMPDGFDKQEAIFADCAIHLLSQAERIRQSVTGDGSAGAYLRARCRALPPAGATFPPAELARACWPMPDAFHHLYLLVLGELISLCEAAEKGRGIRPIRLVA